jgi:hypothetical protein
MRGGQINCRQKTDDYRVEFIILIKTETARVKIMTACAKIENYITPIKKIIDSRDKNINERLHKFIYQNRKINRAHLYKQSVDKTVESLLDPKWRRKIARFNPDEWQRIADNVFRRARKLLGAVPPPEIVLYPSFGSSNGRVYNLDKKAVIGGSPDFPYTTGKNLEVLIAHEYAHFIRFRKMGTPSVFSPIYTMIYDEGWATWLSVQLLPPIKLSQLFMSNLHKAINMPDPPGGYLRWCRNNLNKLASSAQKVIKSKDDKILGQFFQCRRFRGESTPIRVGYYLGYRLIDKLSKELSPRQLLVVRPTAKRVSNWIDELMDTL